MIYNLGNYRRMMVPQIKDWLFIRPGCNPVQEIGLISLATECPIVVVAYLMAEITGWNPELEILAKVLVDFYKVTEVQLD